MNKDVEVGLRNGFWFFFEVEGHQVSIHNSALSGREKIWVDDELVANHLSWSKRSQHVMDIGSRPFDITIATPSLTSGRVICTLSHNGKEIARAEKQLNTRKTSPWALVASVLIGMAVGYFAVRFGISLFSTLFGAQ
jgi:hypothetical protein